jgi:hypothetical protein
MLGQMTPRRSRIVWIAVLSSIVPLSACSTTVFDPRGCPREKEYTKAEQARLAAELPKAGPALQAAMVDYGRLRDKARACRGEN